MGEALVVDRSSVSRDFSVPELRYVYRPVTEEVVDLLK